MAAHDLSFRPNDTTVVAYLQMSNGNLVALRRNPSALVVGGFAQGGLPLTLFSASHSSSTQNVVNVTAFTTEDLGSPYYYRRWKVYGGTLTYNTGTGLFTASIDPTVLIIYSNGPGYTYSFFEPYTPHDPNDDLLSEAMTGVNTSLVGLPEGGYSFDQWPDPVFFGYVYALGYRLVAGVLNGGLLNIYYKVAGGTMWRYAGTTIVPHSNNFRSGRFECAKASPLAGSAVTGTWIFFFFDVESLVGDNAVYSLGGSLETNVAPIVTQTSPINGAETFDQAAETISLVWSFFDADDFGAQLKREVRIADKTPGATIYYLTSGGTLTATETEVTTESQTVNIPPGTLPASAAGYQWQVRIADAHGAYSAWSPWWSFSVSGRPTATITNPPVGIVVTSSQPIITWIYSDPELSVESARRLQLYASDNSLLWDSGLLAAPAGIASGTPDNLQVGLTLANFTAYSVGVLVADSDGIWSSETKLAFSTSITYPPAPTIGVTFDASGIATVTVTAGSPAANQSVPVSCDLYRWSLRLAKYVLVSSGLLPTFVVLDCAGPSNATYRYKVVTTGANGSALDTLSSDVSYSDAEWRLLTSSANIVLSVDEMSFETPTSQDTLEPMGRDYPIVVTHGTRGAAGQISASLIASERISVRDAVEALANTTEVVYLRSPFGEVFAISLGSISETPVTGGNSALAIPFTEVADA